ncbi:MAG: NlpC/P60 family protein [Planctomycetota bacterium]
MKTHRYYSLLLAYLLCAVLSGAESVDAAKYQSPYSIKFSYPLNELIGDIINGKRGDPKEQSSIPFEDWYSNDTLKRYTSWGAPAKRFPPPDNIEGKSADWKRERVLATALHYRGVSYQHHHIPEWNPPAGWPWKEVGHGRNDKGVDCSNFTSFVYNIAHGIRPSSDCSKQAELTQAPGPGVGHTTKLTRIEKPTTVAECKKVLKTGDLLFIRHAKDDEVSHVIMWVGAIGVAAKDVPLIIDSTGNNHKDSAGVTIPDGVQLRPFSENGWYFQRLSHILRFIADE